MFENLEQINQYFEEYGWVYEKVDTETIVSGFQGEHSPFQIFIKFDDYWVYFMLLPFINKLGAEYQENIYQHLLQLNYEMNMVKAGIDQDGYIFLAIELLVSDLDYGHFAGALDALSYYADKYYLQTLSLTTSPTDRTLVEG
jgi:hypothetical protein